MLGKSSFFRADLDDLEFTERYSKLVIYDIVRGMSYDELQKDRIGTYVQSQGFKQLTEPSN